MGYYEGNDYSTPVPAPNEYNNMKDTQRSFFNRYLLNVIKELNTLSVSLTDLCLMAKKADSLEPLFITFKTINNQISHTRSVKETGLKLL